MYHELEQIIKGSGIPELGVTAKEENGVHVFKILLGTEVVSFSTSPHCNRAIEQANTGTLNTFINGYTRGFLAGQKKASN